ncbi:HotDog domain-containing protein [Aspergillus ambiguus]|uniref:PaaI family thioesterase n=1 Tax=Aspergillus ambiguus TaxID=176160 RepID=UPI003CCCBBAB
MDADQVLDYFRTHPKCDALLSNPHIVLEPVASGYQSAHPNPLFNQTLTSNNGVLKSFFVRQSPPPDLAHDVAAHRGYLFLQLGGGVAGQQGIAHGGFLSVVMDQVTGTLIGTTRMDGGKGMFTVALNLSYHRPVLVPADVVIATSRISKVEGRKIYVFAEIEDAQGNVCTTAEAIFLQKRDQKV